MEGMVRYGNVGGVTFLFLQGHVHLRNVICFDVLHYFCSID